MAHAIFGLPPNGKLCVIQQDRAIGCQGSPWWRFWLPTLTCLYLVVFVILPRIFLVLLSKLRTRIYKSRDQELALGLDRAIHDLHQTSGQQGFVNTNSVLETLSILKEGLQNV